MKKIFLLIVALAVYLGLAAAPSVDSIQMANDFYSRKQYDSALDIYTRLVKSGYESPVLFYNTGNTYYKKGDFVHAILFYERARLLDPTNEDIKFNLEVARTNQVDKLDVIPDFFILSWLKSAASVLSSNWWIVLSLVFFFSSLVLLYFFLFSRTVSSKRTLFGIAMALVIISASFYVLARVENKIHSVRESAIVVTQTVTAKSSPDDSGTDLFVIHEGLKVTLIDKVSGWVKIKLSNGSVGWLKKSDVELI